MKIGLAGLGKMGGDMVARLTERDHEVVGYDVDDDAVREATSGPGAEGASSLEDLVERLEARRAVDVGAFVDDSGMGRRSVDYAVSRGIPVPAITSALYERFSSRLTHRYSAKVIAALRNQFGGHAVHEAAP